MNPTAIFSKSGKGVQEASGKTSQLSRGDRAVLSAIDGRATLADVAGKVGKQFDNDFKGLINKLDKDGFIREVSPGAAAPAGPASKPGAPAKPTPSKPTAPMDMASDLDFTAAMAVPKKGGPAAPPPQNVARTPAPPPKPTVVVPPKPPPPSFAEQALRTQISKDQQSAFAKAREEAEEKAAEQRERMKAEAEAKVRAETEAKLRDEAEKKMKADADAAAKKAEAEAAAARSAAVRAAAEAKVKAEAEAKRAKEEAERAKREAEAEAKRVKEEAERARREAEAEAKRAKEEAERAKREAEAKAERARKEAEEKARREQEELKRKLEEERRAREEAERKAKEEAERARRELEEERRKMEEERKARDEENRREEAERAARRKREDEEEQERRAQREAQEAAERAEQEAARKRESEPSLESLMAAQSAPPAAPPPPPPAAKKAATGDAFADSLLADLDSFTQRDDEDRKAKEDAERKAKEEVARRRQEEEERLAREAAEARQREEDERRRKEEEAQRVREEEERRVRKAQEEQEQAEREADERRRKIAAASGAAAGAASDDIGITDDDLKLDEVKKEAALLEKKRNRKEEREKEREKEREQKKERERQAKSKKEKEREEKEAKKAAAAYSPRRRKSNLGRNAFITLLLLAVIGAGAAHVMPLDTAEYETLASQAIGRPVKIGSGRFSAIGGLQFKFENVNVGGIVIPTVRAFPEIGSLIGERKEYSRIELDGMTLPQDALGEALFARTNSDRLRLQRVVAKNLKLVGALPLPVLEADAQLQDGSVRTVALRGGEGLVAKLAMKEASVEFDVNTSQFTLPFAPAITVVQFGMKGEATRSGMKIAQWDGLLYSGHVTGTANVRWGNTWSIDGVITARGVNAAVFAPALLSNGRGEGTGRFTMSGVEPAKLGASGRLEGNFTVTKGVLGSFDLSRALQTNGRQVTGQTQFAEMSGQGVYDRGAVSLRNVNLGAGALNAGASAEITESGALSGRIIADVKTSTQNLRATLIMGGTVTEPTVRN
ncbi:MAG TPA: hypothetical protein VF110_11750 [Burkholderiales bacterium]